MSLRTLGLAVSVLAFLASPVMADLIVLGDSGWSVEGLGTRVSLDVGVIEVNSAAGYVKIWVEQDFGPLRIENGQVDFPTAQVSFRQTSPTPPGVTPVPTIIIESAQIHNHTGATWTQFRWDIFENTAGFDLAASSGWDVGPHLLSWSAFNPNALGHRTIVASGGPGVVDGATFDPSGSLVINAEGDFTLKERVLPEPGTVAVLVAGGVVVALRRRRRH